MSNHTPRRSRDVDGMRGGRLRAAALVSLVVATMMFGQWPAQAHHEPLIQPGAGARMGHTPLEQWGPCTLNYVFRDARHTYIGTAARCTYEVGERVTMADREFGTIVFRAITPGDRVSALTNTSSIDDFALIRVDGSETHRVSPVVLDVGRAPHGVTSSDTTAEGDLLFMTGQGVGLAQQPTRHRLGLLLGDDQRGFRAAIPGTLGDAGAPVLYNDYNAFGVLSGYGAGGAYGTKIERVLELLDDAGFRVELVTAWDDQVRSGRS